MVAKAQLRHTLLVFLCVIAAACGDDAETIDLFDAAEFFPVTDSLSRVYVVEEVIISPLGGSDTSRYELKQVVGDYFLNSSGIENWNLYHYRRPDSLSDWTFLNTTPVRIQEGNYIVTENNIPYVKLTSPLFDGKEWDGNAFNAMPPDTYHAEVIDFQYLSRDEPVQQIKVIQEMLLDTIVTKDIRMEAYVEGVGLTYRESILLNYCTRPDCLGEGIVEDGRVYKQSLKEIW
ncbi:hypothetical protein AB9P05_19045 [Roseivirga sp. BDSF3-8]|uniref:hypothetical protein n=1 Tax=Roseivirga sp. BDSF3-8 TaxID=3241598 RepID=UPI00353204FD